MWKYLLKRLLIAIPTLIVISFIAFFLSKQAPGDPVDQLLRIEDGSGDTDPVRFRSKYKSLARELGYDRPNFYFTFTSVAYPDTLEQISFAAERATLKKLIAQYGNWPAIEQYHSNLSAINLIIYNLPDSLMTDPMIDIRRRIGRLFYLYRHDEIQQEHSSIDPLLAQLDERYSSLSKSIKKDLFAAYDQIRDQQTPTKLYIPKFRWNGLDNQYHTWFSAFIRGDFGRSVDNGRPVVDVIKSAAWWTIMINIISVLLAYLVSIPLGVYSAVKQGKRFDQISSLVLFALYSLPSFWLATILVVFFTTPEYGEAMNIFPSIGLGDTYASDPFWTRFWTRAGHLILPIFCVTYASFAFIARQVRGSVLRVMNMDFVRTAKAKGAKPGRVLWRHTFRNALFPLITLFALIFPGAIAGSVVIEVIFNIPGMGRLIFESIFIQDWPMVFTILMLTAVLTVIGNLLADIFYTLVDPRVGF